MSTRGIREWAEGYTEGVLSERVLDGRQQFLVRIAAVDAIRDAMHDIPHGDTWLENAKELVKERVTSALPPVALVRNAPVDSPSATDAAKRQGHTGGKPNGNQGHL